MSSHTQVLLIPTEKYKASSYGSSDLQSLATATQAPWNTDIKDSDGNCSLSINSDYSKVIDLSGNRENTACATWEFVSDKVHDKYPNLTEWDAVLVADYHGGFSKTTGCSTGPESVDELVAGRTDGTPPVGFADRYSNGSLLFTHELGHMYDGDHKDHMPWGSLEFTIMGNTGDANCDGGITSENRIRRSDFADCARSAIRGYIEYWHTEGYFNPR